MDAYYSGNQEQYVFQKITKVLWRYSLRNREFDGGMVVLGVLRLRVEGFVGSSSVCFDYTFCLSSFRLVSM